MKQYRLLKEIQNINPISDRVCKIGTKSDYEHPYYRFEYSTLSGDTNKFGMDGKYFMCSNPEDYPDWFELVVLPVSEPVKERIEVIDVTIHSDQKDVVEVRLNKSISEGTSPMLKIVISSLLNNDFRIHSDGTWSIHSENQKTYTQSEVDAIWKESADLLGTAICYLKAFVDLNNSRIKADETAKDAKKVIELYEKLKK